MEQIHKLFLTQDVISHDKCLGPDHETGVFQAVSEDLNQVFRVLFWVKIGQLI